MSGIGRGSAVRALFLFHLRVGTRLALRMFTPVVGVFFVLYYILRPEFFGLLVATLLEGGFLLSGIPTVLLSMAISGFAELRICSGLNAWIRHLPVASHTHRRMAAISILVSQLPLLIILAGLTYVATRISRVSATPYFVGLPLVGLSCGLSALPVKRRYVARPLAALAGICFASNSWGALAAGALLFILADSTSGPLVFKKKGSIFHGPFRGVLFAVSIAWRALQLRLLIPYLLSLPLLGATLLFLANNDLSPQLAGTAVRFCGALSLTLFGSLLANMLASRRPPWPWARSLPWSARDRIVLDSGFIGFHALPLLLFVGALNLKSVLPLAAGLPLFAISSSYSIRYAPYSRMGASGRILVHGTIGAFFLSLLPWGALVLLALIPPALKAARKAEQRQKVSRWHELHHLAAGDSHSWSKR